MSEEMKKIKIKDLPPTININNDDVFIESDTLETYKVTANDIAKYVSENKNLTDKYADKSSVGVANGITPLNSDRKIDGNYVTYGTTANTTYEGSSGKVLEQNLDNHLLDSDAHGYNTKINDEVARATNAESDLNTKKAPLANPTLTGTPKAPTASAGTNTTQIATTAFVQTSVSNHNTSTTAHSDIRDLITGLTTRLNALADSDDTTLDQLSEIVAYIKNNKSLIDNITTSKVNVSDIVDSLTSTATNKPLSANQGKVLKELIDTLTSNVSTHTDDTIVHITDTERTKWNSSKTHADSTHARTDATNVTKSTTNGNILINGTETNVYTHPSGTNPHGTTKSDVGLGNVENKSSATIRSELTKENVVDALGYTPSSTSTSYGVATSSALGLVKSGTDITVDSNGNVSVNDDSHNHTIANVDGLQNTLDGKANSSHTHSYLPLNGGTLSGTVNSSKATTTYLAGNQGQAIINSTAGAGVYVMLDKLNSTNGYFTDGVFQNKRLLQYTVKNTVDEGTNSVTKSVTLLDESGNSSFPGNVKASSFSGATATTSANGLMSASDKIKLDYTNIAYCTCSTAAATAAKVATIDGNSKFVLQKGAIAIVKFTVTNTASKCTLNVGNTGAKNIWYNNAVYTGTSNQICGYVNRTHTYVYDGTYWVWVSAGVDANTQYSNASLGQGYGTCTTAAATAAKVVTLSGYALAKGGIVAVKFTYAVPASATMNINSKGAKAIYYKGVKITAGIINAGDIATFMYNGSQYVLIGTDSGTSGANGSNEVVSDTEPTNQSIGDYWLKEY